jgi:hypothetical protein
VALRPIRQRDSVGPDLLRSCREEHRPTRPSLSNVSTRYSFPGQTGGTYAAARVLVWVKTAGAGLGPDAEVAVLPVPFVRLKWWNRQCLSLGRRRRHRSGRGAWACAPTSSDAPETENV